MFFQDSKRLAVAAGQQQQVLIQNGSHSAQVNRSLSMVAAQVFNATTTTSSSSTTTTTTTTTTTSTLSPLDSFDSLFGPLPSRSIGSRNDQCGSPFDLSSQQQVEQCSSLIFSNSNNCSNSSSSSNSYQFSSNSDLSNRLMDFNPEQMNFSEIQELWIRKDWLDIMLRVSFVAPIVLLGIIGNLIIIYSMCKFKPFRSKPTNIFILNMAIADLLTTMVCPIAALFTDIYQFYVLGSFLCRFEGFVKITCLLVSSYSLIVLSLDWLLCVVKPCRTRITIKQSWLALITIWTLSVMMASPLFVWRKLRTRQWKDLLEIWCCELIQYTKYYWVVITFFLIYLPTFIMTIVLVIILAQMDKYEAKLRRSCSSMQSNHSLSINMKYRRRIVKILFTYLLTSIVCWTPLQFTIIYRHFRTEPVPSPWYFELAFFAQLSASLTAAMNPIIFGFLSQPFRRMVAKSLMLKFLDKVVTTNHQHVRHTNHHDQQAAANHHQHNNNAAIKRHQDNNNNQQIHKTNNNVAQQIARNQHLHHHHHHHYTNQQQQQHPNQSASLQKVLSNKRANNQQQVQTGLTASRKRNRSPRNYHEHKFHNGSSTLDHHNHHHNNKRVSFNTSLNFSAQQPFHSVLSLNNHNINGNYTAGRINDAFEVHPQDGELKLSARQQLVEPIIFADPGCSASIAGIGVSGSGQSRRAMSTTSFIQREHHLRPISMVSMDSINIEENLDKRAATTDCEESECGGS